MCPDWILELFHKVDEISVTRALRDRCNARQTMMQKFTPGQIAASQLNTFHQLERISFVVQKPRNQQLNLLRQSLWRFMSCSRKQSCTKLRMNFSAGPCQFQTGNCTSSSEHEGKGGKKDVGMQPTSAAVVVVLQESKRNTRIIIAFNVWQYFMRKKYGDRSREDISSQKIA